MEYLESLNKLVVQRLTDEISAVSMYTEASNYITDISLANEIKEHAEEEYSHFVKVMKFACSHNMRTNYDFDRSVIKNVPKDKDAIIEMIQLLEKKAIKDYKEMTILARENNDIEAEELFMSIMKDEMEHFDDVAQQTGEKRPLGESKELGKFRKYLEEN